MSNKYFVLCFVIMILAACFVASLYYRPVPLVVQTNLERFPMQLGEYSAVEDSFSDSVYRELNADKHVYRHYRSQSGDQIDLYIGYYGTAKGGRTGHNPYACLPGSGAAIICSEVVYLKQAATGKSVPVNYILSRKDGTNSVMLHWYQTAGKTVTSTGLKQNIERFKGRVLHNRNDGAFVRITSNSSEAGLAESKYRAEQFAGVVLNLLPGYWPVEK